MALMNGEIQTVSEEAANMPDEPPRSVGPARFVEWAIGDVRWLVRVIISSCDRFYWDNGFSKAASLAYTSLASLVPLIALCSGILASFAVSNQYVGEVREFLFKQFFPSNEFVDTVLHYLEEFSGAISSLNVLVVGFLVVTSLLLINSMEYALNETWQVYQPRPIPHRIAIFCAILLIAPVMFLSAYYFVTFRLSAFLEEIGAAAFTVVVYKYLVPFVIDYAAFVCLYYLVPKAPVRFRSAIIGAFFAALLFGAAKSGYAWYLETFTSYDRIYKAVAVVPISLLWLYLAWVIVLLGAEASYQAQYLPRSGKVWKRSVMSVGDARLVLAMQSLIMIARAFTTGSRSPNDLELAERLGCSSVVLKPALDALERAGILVRGDSRDMPLALRKSPAMVSISEVVRALFEGRECGHFAKEMVRLFAALQLGRADPDCTLQDVLGESA